MDLTGQVVIVTGATAGIGQAVARTLVDAGMRAVLTGRRAERLDTLVAELGSEHAVAVAGDITDAALPQKLIDAAVRSFGRLDACVNNAGVMHVADIEQTDLAVMSRMIAINVDAATRVAYTVLKHFRGQKSGHLVNVSSILGTKVRPNAGVYAGTKYAVEAMSEALRMEVAGTGVKVSVLEPGLVRTELQDHFPVHPIEAMGIDQPVEPQDIARAVKFMLEQPSHVLIAKMMVLPSQQAM